MTGWINGIGWVAARGCGRGRTAESLPVWNGSLTIPARKDLFDQADLRFGRLDAFSRTGLAGITMCLRDAGREEWQQKRSIGTIAVSSGGCLQTDLDYLVTMVGDGGKLASPNLFAYTLPNCFLGEAALRFGLTGNSVILQQTGGRQHDVVCRALEELTWSACEAMLVGFCDVPVAELSCPEGGYGSLFLLLANTPDAVLKSYGKLERHDETLLFNDRSVAGFADLVGQCLKRR
ncbi:MAG: beta-ketoacyl synthase N-terminal-like domain-containing protein [Pelovirga sp.]